MRCSSHWTATRGGPEADGAEACAHFGPIGKRVMSALGRKRQVAHLKVHYSGLAKNGVKVMTLAALASL